MAEPDAAAAAMLLGFFTYQGAMVAKQSVVPVGELAARQHGKADGKAYEAAGRECGFLLTAPFQKRMLSEM